jgi:pimeloyl-ACP methyl ester carboxylesterase
VSRPAPWAFAAPWGARGYVTDLDGPVHWIEFNGPPRPGDEPPVVFVHGLGGSHLNWCLIGPRLAEGRRAVALDLHGFGLTPGTRATSTVQRNTRLLDRFVREIIGTPVILAGNSMGGLISIMQASGAPDTVAGLVLIDPALPLPTQVPDRVAGSQFLMYALPGLGELYVRSVLSRRPPQLAVQRVIELCFADPSRIDPALLTASVALAAERNSRGSRNEAFLAASRSLMRVVGQRGRYWEMMASVRVPVLLIGGEADRLVPVASMRRAAARNPRWETVILPGVGHTPQLEAPGTVAGTMRDWLGRHFAPAPVGLPTAVTRRNGSCSSSPDSTRRSWPWRRPTPPATSGG